MPPNYQQMTPEQLAEWNRKHQGLGQVTQDQVGVPDGDHYNTFDSYGYNPDANGSQLAGGRGQAMQDYAQDQASRADNERWGYNQDTNASRGEQGQSLGMLRDAAMGNAPSRAELLSKHQMDQAASGQNSLAASARGPAALAMAQQQAAGNTARSMSDISANTTALRADEMARARDAYFGGASSMRGQDQARADGASNRQLGMMGVGQGYAGLEAQGRANDARLGLDAWNSSNAARERAMQREYGYVQDKAKNDQATAGMAMQTGGAVLGALGSDVRAKENIQPVAPNAMEQYLATLSPSSYQYNGAIAGAPTNTQVGPASAQAIAGTQVGQSVVEQRPDGYLAISAPGAIKAGMAADAHINDKASRAEAKADAALKMQANQYADPMTSALMSMGGKEKPKEAVANRALSSLTTAPTVVQADPKLDWLAQQLASINATNNVKGPR
jgi:hypothetical protein